MPARTIESLIKRKQQLVAEIADIGDMRQGSLVGRFRKCGKPTCHCAQPGAKGHGPSWSLTRQVHGKTVTKIIPNGPAVEDVRQQLAEYHHFKKLTLDLIMVSEEICDAHIKDDTASAADAAKKKVLKETINAEIRTEIRVLIGDDAVDGLDFEAIEMAARRAALRIAARAVEQRLNADTGDYKGPRIPCPTCHGEATYRGRHPKTFATALGDITGERAYYHCEHCKSGLYPRDIALGIALTSLSPGVTRMVGKCASMVSFEQSSTLINDLAGIIVDAKCVERTAEALGREIDDDEQHSVLPAEQHEIAPTMYLGIDGTGVPVRKKEVEGRKGKQPDGSAKTREVKLCTIWSAESRDKEGHPRRDVGSISYSAAVESVATKDTDTIPSEFAARVMRETTRRGFDRAPRRALLGDGARWIWNLANEYYPDAIQIVDSCHAKEHLTKVAKDIYGTNSPLAKQWAKQRHDELDAGSIDDILAILDSHRATNKEADTCHGYVTRNRERMKYPEFEAMGLCTTSNVVESGCKLAIGARLKRSGMHWTVAGADAIIALRCCILSGRFEDFWERRAQALRWAS